VALTNMLLLSLRSLIQEDRDGENPVSNQACKVVWRDLHTEIDRGSLQQDFNTLDAPRESAEAFISSQASGRLDRIARR
jgi:hypothetical protein